MPILSPEHHDSRPGRQYHMIGISLGDLFLEWNFVTLAVCLALLPTQQLEGGWLQSQPSVYPGLL